MLPEIGQWNVGGGCVASVEAPFGFAMANEDDFLGSGSCHGSGGEVFGEIAIQPVREGPDEDTGSFHRGKSRAVVQDFEAGFWKLADESGGFRKRECRGSRRPEDMGRGEDVGEATGGVVFFPIFQKSKNRMLGAILLGGGGEDFDGFHGEVFGIRESGP